MFAFLKREKEPLLLPIKTDIHCHIIPGVDDGAPDTEIAVKLVGRMRKWGIERIFASPHVTDTSFENTEETLGPALIGLNEALSEVNNDDFKVSRHAEYRIDDFFFNQLEKGNIKTLPQNYILIENSFMQEPWNLEQVVFDLKLKGYQPILAHPERYSYYALENKQRYQQLHDAGLLFQINLLSLANHYGGYERDTAEWLIEKGYVDFLGTDLHRSRHADSIDLYLKSSRAKKHFKQLEGRLLNDTL